MTHRLCAAAIVAALVAVGSSPARDAAPAPNRAGPVIVKTIGAVTLLALPVTGSFDQHADAIGKLMDYVVPKNLMLGAPLGIYYDDPETVPVDSLHWDIAVPVAPGTKAVAPFVVRRLPEMLAALIVCTGPYEGAAPCYGALADWIAKNGYALVGPVQEHWLSDPMVAPEKMQSQIIFPVAPIRKRP
jgi:AraC family transcriptional regulator